MFTLKKDIWKMCIQNTAQKSRVGAMLGTTVLAVRSVARLHGILSSNGAGEVRDFLSA